MAKPWRDPIELPWLLQVLLPWFEVLGFVWLSVVFLWIPSGNERLDHWLKLASILVAAAVLIASLLQRVVDNSGNFAKPFVECLLRELSQEIWRVDPEALRGPIERHRITLFRVAPRWMPFQFARALWRKVPGRPTLPKLAQTVLHTEYTHKLVPCLRIPASGKRPDRVFYVHEHYEENCQGVAGLAYARGRLATVQLPDLHAPGVTDATFEAYAKLTNDSIKIVKQQLYYSQRIAGVTIYVDGVRWGLLVLDSNDPAAVDSDHLDGSAMKRTLRILTAILEEGLV
jgi:hypothetical protein